MGKNDPKKFGSERRFYNEEENLKIAASCVPVAEVFDEGRHGLPGKYADASAPEECKGHVDVPSGKLLLTFGRSLPQSGQGRCRTKEREDCEGGGSGSEGTEAVNAVTF